MLHDVWLSNRECSRHLQKMPVTSEMPYQTAFRSYDRNTSLEWRKLLDPLLDPPLNARKCVYNRYPLRGRRFTGLLLSDRTLIRATLNSVPCLTVIPGATREKERRV